MILLTLLVGILLSVDNVNSYNSVITIGALKRSSYTDTEFKSHVIHTTNWQDEIGVDIVWSFVDIDNCFAVIQEAKRLSTITDLLIFDDELSVCVGHGLIQTLLPRPILYYKGRQSVYSEANKKRTSMSSYLICGFPDDYGDSRHAESCEVNLEADVTTEPEVSISRAETLFSVVKQLNWQNIFLFYEENTVQEAMMLTDLLSASSIDIFLYDLDALNDTSHVQQLLTENCILEKRTTQFIVLSSINTTRWIISVADNLDKMRNRKIASFSIISEWLLILPSEWYLSIENCVADLDNVAVVIYPPAKYIFIHDMMKGLPLSVKEILKKVGAFNFTDSMDFSILQEETKELFIKYFTHPLMCWHSDIYTLLWKPDGRQLNYVGYVNNSGDVNLEHDIFPNKGYGLNKRVFTINTLPYNPFVVINESKRSDNTTYPYEGYCMDILKEMAMSLNFSFKILGGPPDGVWGLQVQNNSWTGLIGQLQNEEIDIVVAPIMIIADREDVMDFTFPFYHDFISVLIKKPDPDLTKWRTMIDPFRWQVLMCIGIALVGSSVILFLLEKWNPFYSQEPYLNRYAGTHVFQDAFWYMFGAMLTQGGEHLPDSQAGRTMISTWWLFSIIMAATYSGNLIAFLTVSKDTVPFDTLTQLIDQDDYTWGTLGNSYLQMEFENSKNPMFQEIWHRMEEWMVTDKDVISDDHKLHLQRVDNGGYAYIADTGGLEAHRTCDLYILKEKIMEVNYGFGLQNQSAYTEILSKQMMKIYESGLLQIWQRQWWNKKQFCRGPLQTEAKAIGLGDVQSSFYLIGVGLVLAVIALVSERMILRCCMRGTKYPIKIMLNNNGKCANGKGIEHHGNGNIASVPNNVVCQDENGNDNSTSTVNHHILSFDSAFTYGI